jgi:ABC-type transport system substrate-binding protein
VLFACDAPMRILCNPALAAPIAAADSELDETRRLAALGDLAQRLHDDPPVIYLNEQFDLFAVSPKVEGFALAQRVPIYENIKLRP